MKLCNVQPFSKWCRCRTNEGRNFLLLSAMMSVYSDGSWVTKNSIDNSIHCVVQGCVISVFILYFQPQLEGFFACLDIWTVFLDYLIGKVANARSDKLAEAEATVSRSALAYIHCFFVVKVGMYFDKNVKLRILLSF